MLGASQPQIQPSPDLDQLCINTIRCLSIDAVQKANSGHPGLPLGAAPMAYVLWTKFLKHNPANPHWADRDRFVLSAGHGSMLLYSLLHLTGYDLPLEEIKRFRQWGSITPGHPERGLTPGVETTTGPLGQGFGNGVGMALAEAHLAGRFNRPGHEVVGHYTYGIVSDGDLMEGVASEAASLAGHWRLGKLIYLYDNNRVTLAASADLTFSEDVAKRFQGYGWHTASVADGNDLEAIDRAIEEAREEVGRPSLILVRTHIGYGSPNKHDTYDAHGSPLGVDEVRATKENLGWPTEPDFYIPEEALAHFREALEKGKRAEGEWNRRVEDYRREFGDLAREFEATMAGELPAGWDRDIPKYPADVKGMATRKASGEVLNAIAKHVPALMGGSADLNPSTYTALKGMGDFESPALQEADKQGTSGGEWSYAGRNVAFGVREHAMGAIANGMAAHGGTIPYTATFFNFSDYMRPPMRLCAMMEMRVIFIFTHDSLGLGEDGPTHQPVEQLPGLRAVPQMIVIRPGDANETAEAWKAALETKDRPVSMVLSRQGVPTLDRNVYAPADGLKRGAYVLAEAEGGAPELILIASGSEVQLIVAARERLQSEGLKVRCVSMPSWELFEAQGEDYRREVLPPGVKARLAVEAASPLGWKAYVGDAGDVIGVDHFGASAPGKEVLEHYGFNIDNVCEHARKLVKGKV